MAYNALFQKRFFHMFSAATLGCAKLSSDHVTLLCSIDMKKTPS